jgi:23S rRNA pseudouridine1911/1915/1917 synthase
MVNKPGGVLTQAPPGIDCMEVRIKRFLKQRDEKPGNVYLGTPHRLDRPVSGVMVFAKHVRAARRISEQFEGRTVEKTYWAIVEGNVEQDSGTWTDYVRKVPDEARSEIVAEDHDEGKVAILHFRVLDRFPFGTCLEIELETGRTHQIRVQAGSRKHPILGDQLYRASKPFGPQANDDRLRWIALHARSLKIRHPMTREVVCQTAPLPEAWRELGFKPD